MNIATRFAGMLAVGAAALSLSSATPLNAQSEQEIVAGYERNKPGPGGITPSTRTEFATCWMIWKRIGAIIVRSGDTLDDLSPDFTVATADAMFQHWWQKTEQAYGESRQDKMIQEAEAIDISFNGGEKTEMVFQLAGACYVEPAQRVAFAQPRSLTAFLNAANASTASASGQSMYPLPANMQENILDGTIEVKKRRRFKGLQRVLVPHFAVSYGLGERASTSSSSRNQYGAGTSATASTEISGLTEPVLQSLTDLAFADFKQQMAAYGYEVISGREAQEMLFNAQRLRRTDIHEGMTRDLSMYHNFYNGNFVDATFAPTGMRLIDPLWEASLAAKKLDIPALNVQYSVHFAWFGKNSYYDRRAFSGNETMASSIDLNLNVQVIYSSGIEIMGSNTIDNPRISVNEAFLSANNFVRDVESRTSGTSNRRRGVYGVIADPQSYYVEAAKTLSRTNTALISNMASLR